MRRSLTALAGLALVPALAVAAPTGGEPRSAAGTTPLAPTPMQPQNEDEDEPAEEWRGLWVDAFNAGIYDADEVADLVTHATELGVNALVVQVGRRYDCFCNNALLPRTEAAIAPLPYDPLEEVIEQAHAAGIEVHAWINATTFWNLAEPPADPEHAFNLHGPDAEGTDRWLNQREDGEEIINGTNSYMDPAHPDAVDYMVDAVASVAENYDVDGVNLDYIRYPDFNSDDFTSDWGYSEVSLQRFAEATGRTDRPEPDDAEFSDFRRDQVSNLVRKIYVGLQQVDPTLRLSVDAVTYAYGPQSYDGWENARPYANVMQDWSGWVDEGIIDTVTAMNYKRNWMEDQAQMFTEWNEFMADHPGDRHMVSGPALYLNSIYDSLQQAAEVQDFGLDGWMGYAYANPSEMVVEDPSTLDDQRMRLNITLTSTVFEDEVTVPEMTWKTEPTTGMVSGQVNVRGGDVADQVQVRLTPVGGGEAIEVLTDGAGWFGAVGLEPGNYRAQVIDDDAAQAPPSTVRVAAGDVGTVTLTARLG